MQNSSPTAGPARLARMQSAAIGWFDQHRRDLPWRAEHRSAWGVLVSEIMLQQTPVVRVLPVWREWMHRWPTPSDLAEESAAEVLRAWGKLGYPRRALRLQQAAARITDEYDGEVPSGEAALRSLPGVGSYTAAAVAAFAFGQRATVVDTNIRRVQARAFSGSALPSPSLTSAEQCLAEKLLPTNEHRSVQWNASVMELGALICTARSPRCTQCPLRPDCAWVAAGEPEPTYRPKGQSWVGTDRQLRGAIMAVLRRADAYVSVAACIGAVDLVTDVELDIALEHVRSLGHPEAKLRSIIAGLVRDGLAEYDGTAEQIRLPQ